MFHELNINSSV